MAKNKVIFGDTTLIDLTDSTVTPETLARGVVAYNNAGERIVGTMIPFEEIQTQGDWKYRIYSDNTFECWYRANKQSLTITNQSGNLYRSNLITLALPSEISDNYTCAIQHTEVNAAHNNYPCWGMLASISETGINYYAMSGGSRNASPNYTVTAYVFGTLTPKS